MATATRSGAVAKEGTCGVKASASVVLAVAHLATAPTKSSSSITGILPLLIIGFGVVLLMQRSRRNRTRLASQTEQPIDPGREVMLRAGIHGVVTGTEEDFYLVEVAPGVTLRVIRRAIGDVLPVPSSEEAGGPSARPGGEGPLGGGPFGDPPTAGPRGGDGSDDHPAAPPDPRGDEPPLG